MGQVGSTPGQPGAARSLDPDLSGFADKLGPRGLEQSYTVTWDTLAAIEIARYLDRTELDKLKTASFANLREPWGFTEDVTWVVMAETARVSADVLNPMTACANQEHRRERFPLNRRYVLRSFPEVARRGRGRQEAQA